VRRQIEREPLQSRQPGQLFAGTFAIWSGVWLRDCMG